MCPAVYPGEKEAEARSYLYTYIMRFRLDIRKNSFTEKVVKHLNRLPRAVVEALSLEILKRPVGVALGTLFSDGLDSVRLHGIFQSK